MKYICYIKNFYTKNTDFCLVRIAEGKAYKRKKNFFQIEISAGFLFFSTFQSISSGIRKFHLTVYALVFYVYYCVPHLFHLVLKQ